MTTILALIIKSYFFILLAVGASALFFFCVGLYFIIRKKPASQKNISSDFIAIAGDDLMATQLDLARAYIETGQNEFAKNILKEVISNGNISQRAEAKQLLGFI
jgi:FimV-like protein